MDSRKLHITTGSSLFPIYLWTYCTVGARKVYAAGPKNDSASNYYILGQRRARKTPFMAFYAACAGIYHDIILVYNL
jgi:hypothetical protein